MANVVTKNGAHAVSRWLYVLEILRQMTYIGVEPEKSEINVKIMRVFVGVNEWFVSKKWGWDGVTPRLWACMQNNLICPPVSMGKGGQGDIYLYYHSTFLMKGWGLRAGPGGGGRKIPLIWFPLSFKILQIEYISNKLLFFSFAPCFRFNCFIVVLNDLCVCVI